MNWTAADLQRVTAERGLPYISVAQPPKARGAIRTPKAMNKTEASYEAHLSLRKRLGEVLWYRFEGITLKLADDTRYTADFAVLMADGRLELHDCKALWRGAKRPHIEDDALVKLRMAAETFPLTIRSVWALANGEWESKEY